ncbi:MAG TPA: SDR family oxidoreductase [Gemmatimonadaceae bacterium]|nr:SDR family oxidoreductase [Gemmatimonadaceae bacterium]
MTSAPANLFDVSGRTVVVTGGLGQLGRQFATTLLERGARVAILDTRAETAVIRNVLGPWGDSPNMLCIAADVTQRRSLEEALSKVESVLGAPSGLVNNAALDSPPGASADENGPFEAYPESSWDDVLNVNVKGVMLCCQVFGGAMARSGGGSIVNISSIYGMVSPDQRIYAYRAASGKPFFKPIAYSASKAALLNMTRYLSTYWAQSGVRVNTLTLAGVWNGQDDEFLAEYLRRVPLGRMAKETDYNAAIVFMLSDASAYMTGSNLVLDGGWTAW